jgi:hypothetical protein
MNFEPEIAKALRDSKARIVEVIVDEQLSRLMLAARMIHPRRLR